MSDSSVAGGRLGLPAFAFVVNDGPPPLTRRLAARARSWQTPASPTRDPPRPARSPVRWREPLTALLIRFTAVLRVLACAGRVAAWLARHARRRPAVGLAATCGAMLLAFLVVSGSDSAESHARSDAGTVADWISIIRPARIYALDMPDLGGEPRLYEAARRRIRDASPWHERRDVLTFGTFAAPDRPWLRIQIHRLPQAPTSALVLEDLAARHAAPAGLTVGSLPDPARRPGATPTRFGPLQHAYVRLGRDVAGPSLDCLAFRLAVGSPGLAIDGLACETPDRRIAEPALACMVDRLDLQSFGDDLALGRFFAKVEKGRRRECGRPGAGRSNQNVSLSKAALSQT